MINDEIINSRWSFNDFKKKNVSNDGEKRTSSERITDKRKISDDSNNGEKTKNNDECLST